MPQDPQSLDSEGVVVAVIPQDPQERVQIRRISSSPLEAVRTQQSLVRGTVARVGLQQPRASLLIHEESKTPGLEINARANVLARAHQDQPGAPENIIGPAVLCGPLNGRASETSLPEHYLTLLRHEGAFRAQVRTHQDPEVWSGNDVRFDSWHWAYVWVLALAERWTEVKDVRVVPTLSLDLVQEWIQLGNHHLSRRRPGGSSGQLFANGITACYSSEELIQNISSSTALDRAAALSYRDLCIVNQSRDLEDWFGIRAGVVFSVPELLPKIADGTFADWMRRVLAAEPATIQAAASV